MTVAEAGERAYQALLDASAALTPHLDAWGSVPATLATMRALKARFDPGGVLAPGRFVGGI